jgi:precorrin-8X/cobalt-precorrin-8 methylmutase
LRKFRAGAAARDRCAVGFVHVVEAKEQLIETLSERSIPYIVARGRQGGSNVAAAVCNALLYQASMDRRE